MSKVLTVKWDDKNAEAMIEKVLGHLRRKQAICLYVARSAPYEKVGEFIAIAYDHRIQVEIRDATLRDYLKHGTVGATLGAGVSAWGLILIKGGLALTFSGVIPVLLTSALLGCLAGAALAPIGRLEIHPCDDGKTIELLVLPNAA